MDGVHSFGPSSRAFPLPAHASAQRGSLVTEGKRDFKSFLARWEQFKPILDAFGVNYAENRVALAKI